MTTPERAPRCLLLVISRHGVNRCTSEQVGGSGLCAHHLARAVEDYRNIISPPGDTKEGAE